MQCTIIIVNSNQDMLTNGICHRVVYEIIDQYKNKKKHNIDNASSLPAPIDLCVNTNTIIKT